jgi:hypothetical protein
MKVVRISAPRHPAKAPMAFSMLPDRWASYIGNTMVLWGRIEVHTNDFIASIIAHNGTVPRKGWERSGFKDRKILLTEEMGKAFGAHPEIKRYLTTLLLEHASLSTFRNMLAHGHMWLYRIPSDYVIVIQSYKDRHIEELQMREAEAESIYYDTAHLAAKMGQIVSSNDIDALPLPSPDKSLLQAILQKTPASRTTPSTPQPRLHHNRG